MFRPKSIASASDSARVRVVAEALAGQRRGERAVAGELVRGRVDAALELVRREAVLRLERRRVRDELLRRAHLALARDRIGVAEEQVARELDGVAQLAAEQRVHGHAELLAHDVEARELDRRVQLRAVVVEARRRVADLEAQRLEREHVVAREVGQEPGERARRVLAAAAHLAQADVAVGSSRPRRSCARSGPSARRCCAGAAPRAGP